MMDNSQQIDIMAEQLRVMLSPYFQDKKDLDKKIDWVKHNAKAINAWQEGKPIEFMLELFQVN